MDKVLLTIEEAAQRLSIGRTKAFELVAQGEIETVTIGRCRRVTPEALAEFVGRLAENRPGRNTAPLLSCQHCTLRGTPAEQQHPGASPTIELRLGEDIPR
jgi:excisionase family DNA binding protein